MRLTTWSVLVTTLVVLAVASPTQAATTSGRHIVVLKDGVGDSRAVAADHARRYGVVVDHVYRHALNGYAGGVSGRELGALRADGRVAYVELDGDVSASTTQSDATWGLDRVDQRIRSLNGTYVYTNTGATVTAYVIDTGIRYSHGDFGGRASFGYDAFGETGNDCNGHGTHVAGTVGGSVYGVAKTTSLVSVRVLDCSGSGTWSGVIAGVDYVTGRKNARPSDPMVANMSLGGGANTSVDTAVKNSIAKGVSYAVAAGNGNAGGKAQNACNYSPARVAEAMTIGATTKTDAKTSWSNYGNCVDWFAPGASITSAWHTGDTATSTISGTSMAAPHSAGVAAQYLQANPGASARAVRDAVYAKTTKGIVSSSKTINNHLLFTDH